MRGEKHGVFSETTDFPILSMYVLAQPLGDTLT